MSPTGGAVAGGIVSTMVSEGTSPPASTAQRPPVFDGVSRGAVFVDLDRTLLRGASGLVLSVAMHAEGLFEGRPSLPGERLFYSFYDLVGETLPFMAMVRAAARFVRGWPVDAVERAGSLAAAELAELVQPYAPAVLAEHRAAGRPLVLATTSPADLIGPFAELFGFDHVLATRYARSDGRYTGRIDGEFVWSSGKLAAARRFAARTRDRPAPELRLLRQRVRPAVAARRGPSPPGQPGSPPAHGGARRNAGPSSAGIARPVSRPSAGSSPTTCCATSCAPSCSPMPASTSRGSTGCRCAVPCSWRRTTEATSTSPHWPSSRPASDGRCGSSASARSSTRR